MNKIFYNKSILNNLKLVNIFNKNSFLYSKIQSKNFSVSTQVQPWIEKEERLAKLRGELVLSDRSHIKNYVIDMIKNYYRTTNRDSLKLDSRLQDHGLDSLDSIELCCQLEDELGYIIEAETMTKITSVKHLVNFIEQLEAYKQEFKVLPQERATEPDENWEDWLPKGELIKTKLFRYTKKKTEAPKH